MDNMYVNFVLKFGFTTLITKNFDFGSHDKNFVIFPFDHGYFEILTVVMVKNC